MLHLDKTSKLDCARFKFSTMKKIYLLLAMLTWTMGMSAQGMKKKGDTIRQQLTWLPLAAPSNEEGEIEKLFLAYNTPDGKEHHLVCEMPWPVPADQFVGGDIEEEDINFDGIPDLQVWDTKSHSFIEVSEPAIISPSISPENKRITTRIIMDDIATYEEYKWEKGKLVKIDEWTEDLKELYDE